MNGFMLCVIVIYVLSVIFAYVTTKKYLKEDGTEPTLLDVCLVILPICNIAIIIVNLIEFATKSEKKIYKKFFNMK